MSNNNNNNNNNDSNIDKLRKCAGCHQFHDLQWKRMFYVSGNTVSNSHKQFSVDFFPFFSFIFLHFSGFISVVHGNSSYHNPLITITIHYNEIQSKLFKKAK